MVSKNSALPESRVEFSQHRLDLPVQVSLSIIHSFFLAMEPAALAAR
jgi:hypothetical protein